MNNSFSLFIGLFCIFWNVRPYGAMCRSQCRFGEDYCDGISCLYGCEPGYTGIDCKYTCYIDRCLECVGTSLQQNCTLCDTGYYGNRCQYSCSDHCKFGNQKCDKDGKCLYGCQEGFYGDPCNDLQCPFTDCLKCAITYSGELYCQICIDEKYYDYSSKKCLPCNVNCISSQAGKPSCNSTTGICVNGCQDGYFGALCDKECKIANCMQCRENQYNSYRTHCNRCEVGFYTNPAEDQCLECSKHCANGACDPRNGQCREGCEKGWVGVSCNVACHKPNCTKCATNAFETIISCEQCDKGFYVNDLDCVECSEYCKDCNGTNGDCIGCVGNRYGRNCEVPCNKNCVNEQCIATTGDCLHGCNPGWFSEKCDRRCPKECFSCEPFLQNGRCESCNAGWYGDLCEKKCSENCLRDVNTFLYCHKDTGKCTHGCDGGIYGDTCNLTCSQHCNFQKCAQTTGYCTYGCSNDRFGNKCEKACPEHCAKDFGDLSCNKLTEMCLWGCEAGFYGNFCNNSCPEHCKNKNCDSTSATLGRCMLGCEDGYYGTYCNETCPMYCKDKKCNQISGTCLTGCADGKHGENCSLPCSRHCKGMVCNMFGGYCVRGCEEGYYGNTCENLCSRTCLNETCNIEGECDVGCVEGKTGARCQDNCPIGRYGKNCTEACGRCKENTICDPVSGSCELGCEVGYTTSLCKTGVVSASQYVSENDGTSTVAVAGSVTAAVLLTILLLSIVAVLVRRKNKQSKSTNSEDTAHEVDVPMETFGFGVPENVQQVEPGKQNLIQLDIINLQIYDELASSRGLPVCQMKTGKYCDSLVHVKVISRDVEKQNQKLFVHEIDILKRLKHHMNIVTLLGFCYDQDHMYHVFRPCDQGDLLRYLQRLRRSSADWAGSSFKSSCTDLLQFALNVIAGLQYLHENGVVHRLIAATNIFIDSEYVGKIGNFYYAVIVQESEEAEHTQVPEIPQEFRAWASIESQGRNIFTYESDIWSFGVLLWELASMGQNPMDQGNTFPKMAPFPPPQGCDREVYRVMEQCWRATPSARLSLTDLQERLCVIIDNHKCQMNEENYPMLTSTTV